MPDGQISNTRKLSHLGLYASKTIGSLRLATLTKYLSIACLSLAILSTLILNIVSSYSSSSTKINATDSSYNKYQSTWTKVTFSACKLATYHSAVYTTSSGYALCQDGRLYVWGNNSHGQLGIGSNESVSADSPIDISSLLDGRIQYVSISSSSIALTDNGQVYAWGSNDDGQLGVGDFNDRLSPTDITESFQLDNDDRVIVACMASLSSFALTNNGRVYT